MAIDLEVFAFAESEATISFNASRHVTDRHLTCLIHAGMIGVPFYLVKLQSAREDRPRAGFNKTSTDQPR